MGKCCRSRDAENGLNPEFNCDNVFKSYFINTKLLNI
jgi:hypothetical protein